MQLWKESLKKSGLPGFEPSPLRYRRSALTNWANKPTAGSWSLNWFVIYPGKMNMKLWIYEITLIFFTLISSFRSSNIWISYIHNFMIYKLSDCLMNHRSGNNSLLDYVPFVPALNAFFLCWASRASTKCWPRSTDPRLTLLMTPSKIHWK